MKSNLNTSKGLALVAGMISLLLTACTTTQDFRNLNPGDQTVHILDSICMEVLYQEKYPGLAIAVVHGGKKLWSKGYGYADLELKQAVDPSGHLFRIGSVSKSMTASALARLTEKGSIDLDVPIENYYRECPDDKKEITLRQLGGHIAGIRHYKGAEFLSNIHYDHVRDALEVFIHDDLLFKPGTDYYYTTYGWTLISAVMEDAVDKSFLKILDEEVKHPLQLKDLKADHIDSIHFKRVQFYELLQGNHIVSPKVDNSNKWAGGGLLCSAEDLAKYGFAHVAEGYLQKATLKEFTTSQFLANGEKTEYGIGFRLGSDESGKPWYGHSGGAVGGTSMLLIYPSEKLVIVTLVNLSGAKMNDLAWKIADVIRNQPGKN